MKYYPSIKAFACGPVCRNAFRSDRAAGLNYGLFKYANGKFAKDREEVSRNLFCCAYCDKHAKLEIEVNKNFVEVTSDVFRSWAGKHKIDGKEYKGPIYYFLSDTLAQSCPIQ
jgi:hypothetical protein